MIEKIRKAIHLCALLIPLLSEFTSRTVTITIVSTITIAYIFEEFLRLNDRRIQVISEFILKMSRPEERSRFIMRPLYLAVGVIFALAGYTKLIAYASICVVAIGDPIAALVGGRLGRTHIRKRKTAEGFAAGLIASFLMASLLISPALALVGAVAGMLMELLDFPDDNLAMPIISGAMMTLASIASH